MKTLIYVLIFAVTFASGCGGGTSGGTTNFAGLYAGNASGVLSIRGQSTPISGLLEILINPDGTAVSDPDSSFQGNGTISGNRVNIAVPATSFNEPGFSCSGNIVIEGTVSGSSINGTLASNNLACNGVPASFNASFVLNKATHTRSGKRFGDHLWQTIKGA